MKILREYFHLDKRQERGLLVLILIIVLVILFNHFAPRFFSKSQESLIGSKVYVEKISVYTPKDKKSSFKNNKVHKPIQLCFSKPFDPNTISIEELKDANMPIFVAENWIKYLRNGAFFKTAKDVNKIYGMNEDLYGQMEKWIKVEPKTKEKTVERKERSPVTEVPVEMRESNQVILGINTADSVQLLEVNGIGPFYAGALVRYRERLGGFNRLSQLLELYKMDSSKLDKMLPQLYLDSVKTTKISINQAEFKDILRHPYFDFETTKYILNKRRKLGKYAALYELKDPEQLPDSLYEKILPYIQLDD